MGAIVFSVFHCIRLTAFCTSDRSLRVSISRYHLFKVIWKKFAYGSTPCYFSRSQGSHRMQPTAGPARRIVVHEVIFPLLPMQLSSLLYYKLDICTAVQRASPRYKQGQSPLIIHHSGRLEPDFSLSQPFYSIQFSSHLLPTECGSSTTWFWLLWPLYPSA